MVLTTTLKITMSKFSIFADYNYAKEELDNLIPLESMIHEDDKESKELIEEINTHNQALEHMLNIYEVVKKPDFTFDKTSGAILRNEISTTALRIGYAGKVRVPSIESFSLETRQETCKKVSLEGLGDFIKSMLDKLIELIKKFWNWITGNSKSNEKKTETIIEKAKEVEKEQEKVKKDLEEVKKNLKEKVDEIKSSGKSDVEISIDVAKELNVEDDKIIHNVQDLDNFINEEKFIDEITPEVSEEVKITISEWYTNPKEANNRANNILWLLKRIVDFNEKALKNVERYKSELTKEGDSFTKDDILKELEDEFRYRYSDIYTSAIQISRSGYGRIPTILNTACISLPSAEKLKKDKNVGEIKIEKISGVKKTKISIREIIVNNKTSELIRIIQDVSTDYKNFEKALHNLNFISCLEDIKKQVSVETNIEGKELYNHIKTIININNVMLGSFYNQCLKELNIILNYDKAINKKVEKLTSKLESELSKA